MVTYEPDPELGWQHPGFDAANPAHRRKALRYVVSKKLSLNSVGQSRFKRRRWAVRAEDGRWQLSPDESQMPRIRQMDGTVATFDAETRAEIDAGKAAQVAVVARSADRRSFDRLDEAEQATVLRWLTEQLAVDRAASVRVRPVLNDLRRRITTPELALDKLRDLLCREPTRESGPLDIAAGA